MKIKTKRCPNCEHLMTLDGINDEWDCFDEDLARAHGHSDADIAEREFVGELVQFYYTCDYWKCFECGYGEPDREGTRYYFNPDSGHYDAPKPSSPKEEKRDE